MARSIYVCHMCHVALVGRAAALHAWNTHALTLQRCIEARTMTWMGWLK